MPSAGSTSGPRAIPEVDDAVAEPAPAQQLGARRKSSKKASRCPICASSNTRLDRLEGIREVPFVPLAIASARVNSDPRPPAVPPGDERATPSRRRRRELDLTSAAMPFGRVSDVVGAGVRSCRSVLLSRSQVSPAELTLSSACGALMLCVFGRAATACLIRWRDRRPGTQTRHRWTTARRRCGHAPGSPGQGRS